MSLAQSIPPCGLTSSRPAERVPSDLTAMPLIQATFLEPTLSSEVITMAQAPSEDGQLSKYRKGSQSIGVSLTIFSSMPGI